MTQRKRTFRTKPEAMPEGHTGPRFTAVPATSWTQLTASAGLAMLLSACDGRPPLAPTAAADPPGSPQGTYTLSGSVSELTATGPLPVVGAVVREEKSLRHTTTDGNGSFSISGLATSSIAVAVSKAWYVAKVRTITITADTRLDFEVERVVTSTLTGTVFEVTPTGRVPLADVSLLCDSCVGGDGYPGHVGTSTDTRGFYAFPWASNGRHPLVVTKAGYEIFDPTGKLRDQNGGITATVDSNTQFDIEMVRR